MILAAGLGTRLRPLTDSMPKALVRFRGTTLLEHAITHLQSVGVDSLVINVHHFADQIIAFLYEHKNFGMEITISDERDRLMDTGGGLKKAEHFLDDPDPFFLYNVDIISDMDLALLMDFHKKEKALATVAVRARNTSRYFLFSESNLLCGWINKKTGEKILSAPDPGNLRPLANSGIQVIDPAIFPMIREEGPFSIVTLYLRLAQDHRILGYQENDSYWKDAGRSPEELNEE